MNQEPLLSIRALALVGNGESWPLIDLDSPGLDLSHNLHVILFRHLAAPRDSCCNHHLQTPKWRMGAGCWCLLGVRPGLSYTLSQVPHCLASLGQCVYRPPKEAHSGHRTHPHVMFGPAGCQEDGQGLLCSQPSYPNPQNPISRQAGSSPQSSPLGWGSESCAYSER